MIGSGRRKSIIFFIALGIGMIVVALLLYLGGIVLDWRAGVRLFFGILLLLFGRRKKPLIGYAR